jgi:hypothetical protein
LRLHAIRQAVQRDIAQAGQIEQRAGTAKLKQALGLGGQAVTVVNGCTCENSGSIEMSGGSLRYNAERRDSSGSGGQADAHQEKRQRHS